MTARQVFINEVDQLRAGWRIAIFIGILAILLVPAGIGMSALAGLFGQTNMKTVILTTLISAITGGLACWLSLKLIDKRAFASMGMNLHARAVKELIWGLVMGFLMLTGSTLVMWAMGWVSIEWPVESTEYFLVGFTTNLILFIIVGFNEEILFRGYSYQTLSEGTNYWIAMIAISALFGIAHMGNPNAGDHPLGILNIVLAGILLSYAYVQTRSLWFPIGIHISWNFTEGYVSGLPVSGTSVFQPLVKATSTGPDWITGGTFGPEGGIVCSIVCVAAIFVIWKHVKPTEEMIKIVEEARAVRAFPSAPSEPAVPAA